MKFKQFGPAISAHILWQSIIHANLSEYGASFDENYFCRFICIATHGSPQKENAFESRWKFCV